MGDGFTGRYFYVRGERERILVSRRTSELVFNIRTYSGTFRAMPSERGEGAGEAWLSRVLSTDFSPSIVFGPTSFRSPCEERGQVPGTLPPV